MIHDDGKVLPGYGFFHIPLPEYLDMSNAMLHYGNKREGICCSSVNTGLYSVMKEMDNIKSVFCGHDHTNDFWGHYYGIDLYFGRKTGHGGYGPPAGM